MCELSYSQPGLLKRRDNSSYYLWTRCLAYILRCSRRFLHYCTLKCLTRNNNHWMQAPPRMYQLLAGSRCSIFIAKFLKNAFWFSASFDLRNCLRFLHFRKGIRNYCLNAILKTHTWDFHHWCKYERGWVGTPVVTCSFFECISRLWRFTAARNVSWKWSTQSSLNSC